MKKHMKFSAFLLICVLLLPDVYIPAAAAETETETYSETEVSSETETYPETEISSETETFLETETVSETEAFTETEMLSETEAESEEVLLLASESGTVGDLKWTLSDKGVLTISGSGPLGSMDPSESVTFPYKSTKAKAARIKKAVIKGGVTLIGAKALSACPNLTEVTIPKSVQTISSDAFLNTPWLTEQGDFYVYKNTLVGYYGSAVNVTVPEGVQKLGDYCFKNLTRVILPDNVTAFTSLTFARCKNTLTTVTMGAGISTIPKSAFAGFKKLTDVTIGRNVTTIEALAFANNPVITKISIPPQVNWMDGGVFYNCQSLTDLTILARYFNKRSDPFFNGTDKYNSQLTITAYKDCQYANWLSERLGIPLQYIQKASWKRLWGKTRYDTMQTIVKTGFTKKNGTVIVATGAGFKDALAASGLAGIFKGPVILTDGKKLSAQAETELVRLAPAKIYIAGGESAVSAQVSSAIQKVTGVKPERLAGKNSAETSAKLALAGKGSWSNTAVIATNKSFKDALSAAPLAYAGKMPVLLADNGKSVSQAVLDALKTCGIRRVIIVGGEAAVSPAAADQLTRAGLKIRARLWGKNGVATSAAIAAYGIDVLGLSPNNMGVATSQNYPDALAGAAFCGFKRSVLILADDKATQNTSFPADYAGMIKKGFVFGGETAVGKKTLNLLQASTE